MGYLTRASVGLLCLGLVLGCGNQDGGGPAADPSNGRDAAGGAGGGGSPDVRGGSPDGGGGSPDGSAASRDGSAGSPDGSAGSPDGSAGSSDGAGAGGTADGSSPDGARADGTPDAISSDSGAVPVTFPLAKDGKALAPIVISERAGEKTKVAVEELKTYLSQISGAVFQVQTGNGESGLVVGAMSEFPVPELSKPLEIVNSIDGKEAYAIRTQEKRLLLVGATDLAVSHAVYRFLEELGCRWFFPNPTGNWEVIPSISDLKFNKDLTDRPVFLERRIWYAWGLFQDGGHPASTSLNPRSAASDYADWSRRNHMAGSFVTNTGHAYETIARENAAEFAMHPEYWALVDGKRTGPQFELGNPGLRKLVIDWAVDYFKKNPNADMVSVDPADGAGVSQSEEAKAYANANDSPFKLANEVAVALQNAYPGQNKMVGLYAYNWHSDPPPFALEPNVYIQLTMAFNGGLLTLDQLFEEWPKKVKNLGFYDYYSTWRWDFDMWPGGRVANKSYPIDMVRRFQKTNGRSGAYATSISAESSNNWGVNGRGYYLANKLMWNPGLDAEALLDDFYQKAFGPAAAAMKKYYGYQDSSPPISPGVVGLLFRTMREARDLAKGDEAVMRRLDDLSTYLRYYDMAYRGGDANTIERWKVAYRARYRYMNHWAAIINDALGNNTDPNAPWRSAEPITRQEIESWLDAAIQFYPELRIPNEIKFSRDLVPVDFGGSGVATSQLYQEGSIYSIYSNGAPIHIKIDAGTAYGGLRQTYDVMDATGKVLLSGLPKPGEKVEFDYSPPAPGVYSFHYHDHGAYGQVYWGADQIVSLPMGERHFRAMARVNDMYFYVPKGSKEINYYYKRADWQFGGAHQITDPTGKVVKEVAVDGDYVAVAVAPGTDGSVWKIGGPTFGLGYFRFFDIPGYLSPNANKMLVPSEVAVKDGLTIVK
jgi:hypothetical protein